MTAIVQNGDPVLRAIAPSVPEELFGTPALQDMIDRMAAALDAEKDGVAIAAPQVGISYRIFLIRYDRITPRPEGAPRGPVELGVYINPQFVRSSRKREEMDEGCLSVRGIYGRTVRHVQATVEARTVDGSYFERGGGGVLAQAFQHESDHLDGVLFIDHAVSLSEVDPHERSTSHEHVD